MLQKRAPMKYRNLWRGERSCRKTSFPVRYLLVSHADKMIIYLFERGTNAPFSSSASQSLSNAHLSLESSSPESKTISLAPFSQPRFPAATFAATFPSAIHRSMSFMTEYIAGLYRVRKEASLVVIFKRLLYCLKMGANGDSGVGWKSGDDDGLMVGRKYL